MFLLLNIEIADYYSTGPTIAFRFGTTVSQDLTYTIGWLAFGMLLLGGHVAALYAGGHRVRTALWVEGGVALATLSAMQNSHIRS